MNRDLNDERINYNKFKINDLDVPQLPITLFNHWLGHAKNAKLAEFTAFTLSTLGLDGFPNSRILLLKETREDGFVFYTNYKSQKGLELERNPNASMVIHWREHEQQVRIKGKVSKLPSSESDRYFDSRPIESRIGAIVSEQSIAIDTRELLQSRFDQRLAQYHQGENLMRPNYWGGYILKPSSMEFWQGRPGRLHDRILYTQTNTSWTWKRLQP